MATGLGVCGTAGQLRHEPHHAAANRVARKATPYGQATLCGRNNLTDESAARRSSRISWMVSSAIGAPSNRKWWLTRVGPAKSAVALGFWPRLAVLDGTLQHGCDQPVCAIGQVFAGRSCRLRGASDSRLRLLRTGLGGPTGDTPGHVCATT
jgi:hypothetical protein